MTKDKFCKIINELHIANKVHEDVNAIFRENKDEISLDFHDAGALTISHESTVVSLLSEIMNDKDDWIAYWIYELCFGANYEHGSVSGAGGMTIDLSTSEKLYEFLISNSK